MENLEEKTEVLDGADESAESQNNLELNDIKGNNITIEDAKATLTHNSDLIQGAINGENKAFNELYLQSYRYNTGDGSLIGVSDIIFAFKTRKANITWT